MVKDIEKILRDGGIENYRQEARWIVKYAAQSEQLAFARRRAAREPLQYILGEWEFYGYDFKVGKGVLIPRPETELLVDCALDNAGLCRGATVYDLCAGSGCVGIALAKKTDCNVTAVEKSDAAIEYLRGNVALNGVQERVRLVKGDVFDVDFANTVSKKADCILLNPPYLSKAEMESLQTEVSFEPITALLGGEDGLDFYRAVFKIWGESLKPGGLFAAETGDTQCGDVIFIMEGTGLFEKPKSLKDFNDIERVVYSYRVC